jgi:hypothetical protein
MTSLVGIYSIHVSEFELDWGEFGHYGTPEAIITADSTYLGFQEGASMSAAQDYGHEPTHIDKMHNDSVASAHRCS